MKSSSIFITVLLLLATHLSAQTTIPKLARIAGKGIIVFAGEKIPTDRGAVTGYKIERKATGDADYKTVAELKAVASVSEFKTRFSQTGVLLPYAPYLEGFKLDSIWTVGTTKQDIRALGVAGISLPALYGFNMVWMDETVQVNSTYQYRVTALGSNAVSLSSPMVYARNVVIAQPHFILKDFTQDGIKMKWYSVGKNKPAHIDVLRSDNKAAFHKVNTEVLSLPIKDTAVYTIIDSTIIPNQIYDYYLVAYDALGNAAPNTDTIRMSSSTYTRMYLPENISTTSDTVDQGIRITWTTHNAVMLKKLVLYKSENSLKGFKAIATLAPTDSVYTDVAVTPATSYFYYFEGVAKMENAEKQTTLFAGRYEETRMPTSVDMYQGEATPQGISLSWVFDRGLVNNFQVYRMRPECEMQLVGQVMVTNDTQTIFRYTDTVSGLSSNTFYGYAVKAVSTSNVGGMFSDTLYLKPLKASEPPATPTGLEVIKEGKNIMLTWNDMKETDSSVVGYIVVRNSAKSVDTILAGRNMFTDTSIAKETKYSYTVFAVNIYGKRSALSETLDYTMSYDRPAAPSSITASPKKEGIYISWQQPENGANYNYNVYRYTRESAEKLVGKVAQDKDTYLDATANKGELYFYKVRAESKDKKESADSDEVGVRFE